ncbi:MAG: hypothetical protein EA371_13355 [Gammaproteobacteria bacterium]|nr:MAG: hypothetical protein EA371_13355 [Gammaproteobacteria bacterium]
MSCIETSWTESPGYLTRSRCSARLRPLAGVLAALAITVSAHAETPPTGRALEGDDSRLATLVATAPEFSADARLELAGMIVEAALAAYEQELETVRQDLQREGGDPARLTRWYRATAPIVGGLRAAQAQIPVAQRLVLHTDRQGQVLLLIDGEALWISWPRPSAQRRLERELVEAFCQRHDCPGRARSDPDEASTGITVTQDTPLTGQWALAQLAAPTWTSTAGVRCEFSDLAGRADKEALCRALIGELETLATALRRALRRGEQVDWPRVRIARSLPAGEHALVVNAQGDYLPVVAPLLASEPVDWSEAQRWLQARVDGHPALATVRRAVDPR